MRTTLKWNDHPTGTASSFARPICKQVPCSDFTTSQTCNPRRCKWEDNWISDQCVAKDPCSTFTTSQMCDPNICQWEDNLFSDNCVPKKKCTSTNECFNGQSCRNG